MKEIEVSSTSHQVDMKLITQVSEYLEVYLNECYRFHNEDFDQFVIALHVFPSESELYIESKTSLFKYKKDRFIVFNVLFSSEEMNAWAVTEEGLQLIKLRVETTIQENEKRLSKVGFEKKK